MNNQEEKNSKRRFNNIYRIAEEQNIKVYVNKDTTEMDVPKLKVIQLNGRKPTIRFIYGSGEEKKIFAKKLFKALEEANIPCSLSDKESSIVLDDTLTVKSVAVTKKTYTKGVKKVDLSELGQSLKDFIVMLSPEQRDLLFPQKPVPVSEINPSTIVDKISQNFYFISKKNKAAKLFEATPGFFENNESVLKKIKK